MPGLPSQQLVPDARLAGVLAADGEDADDDEGFGEGEEGGGGFEAVGGGGGAGGAGGREEEGHALGVVLGGDDGEDVEEGGLEGWARLVGCVGAKGGLAEEEGHWVGVGDCGCGGGGVDAEAEEGRGCGGGGSCHDAVVSGV